MKSQVIKKQFYVWTICDTDGSFFLAKQVNFHHAEEEHTHCLIAKEFNNSCTTKV